MALVPFPNKGRAPAPNEERDPDWDDSEHEDSAAGDGGSPESGGRSGESEGPLES